MPDTLARSIVNAPGKDSWPIAGYTYLLVYMDQQDCAKAQKLVAFINWALDRRHASPPPTWTTCRCPTPCARKVLDQGQRDHLPGQAAGQVS